MHVVVGVVVYDGVVGVVVGIVYVGSDGGAGGVVRIAVASGVVVSDGCVGCDVGVGYVVDVGGVGVVCHAWCWR